MHISTVCGQLLRYAIGGIVSNTALYAGYLLLTAYGAGHKSAMTCVYLLGVVATFLLNRQWTFGDAGTPAAAFLRYAASYALLYLLNMSALYLLVDRAGLPHQWVVLVLVFASACITFALQRFWVFQSPRSSSDGRICAPQRSV